MQNDICSAGFLSNTNVFYLVFLPTDTLLADAISMIRHKACLALYTYVTDSILHCIHLVNTSMQLKQSLNFSYNFNLVC